MEPIPILVSKVLPFVLPSGRNFGQSFIPGHKFATLFQLAAYLGEVDMVNFLIDQVDINFNGEPFL
jgi:hypothetical protein